MSLSHDELNRAAMGRHLRTRHAQQMLRPMGQFTDATLDVLRGTVPKNWSCFRDFVTDNFRVISAKEFPGSNVNGVYRPV